MGLRAILEQQEADALNGSPCGFFKERMWAQE